VKKARFDRLWYVKRRHVLDSIKCGSRREESGKSWFYNNGGCVPQTSFVNPYSELISSKSEEILGRGPKCCLNIKPSKLDVFSCMQTIARKVNPDERVAFIDVAVSKMEKVMGNGYPNDKRNFREISGVKIDLEARSVKLLQTDKSGKFAILPRSVFQMRTDETMNSLFSEWNGNIAKLRTRIGSLLKEDDLEGVAKSLLGPTRSTLSVQFFLKDHKPEMPLRAVNNECGTWQKSVSKFLQNGLRYTHLDKSLSLRNSNDHGRECSVLSMDIKDLNYSLEKNRLMTRMKDALESNLVQFQSQTGISLDSFLVI
ncbi:unnamed protein product, partial [Ixodes hexagonus]